ncbi:FixH family protein [Desertivirga arenae]|uniref:FixH family protein n=1 Tax=Desertivirga arenae TaxID=2810309 RepID=UPI001A95EE42|nr:FixH family protein [Pedobacter sp. SYSU D00823]
MNWGKKIVFVMFLFMSFIVFLSARMVLSDNDELIDKNYYEEGLNYDKEYNAHKAALKDSVIPELDIQTDGIHVSFPCDVEYKINSKCLANAGRDHIYKGSTVNKALLIPSAQLRKGEWVLNFEYTAAGKVYQVKKEIIMP